MYLGISRQQIACVVLTLVLAPTAGYAMSGMDMPHSGHGKSTSSLSKSLGEPLNTSESEIEITSRSPIVLTEIPPSSSPAAKGACRHPVFPITSISGWPTR